MKSFTRELKFSTNCNSIFFVFLLPNDNPEILAVNFAHFDRLIELHKKILIFEKVVYIMVLECSSAHL